MAMVLTVAMVLTLSVFTSGAPYNAQAAYAMQGYVELTGDLQFGATTITSGVLGRTAVNNHEYVAAVSGTGGRSSNGSYTFNEVDYRAAFDSAIGDELAGASYYDGPKTGFVGIEFKTAQKVTQIACIPRQDYGASRLVGAQFQGSDNGVNFTTLFTINNVNANGTTYITSADGLNVSKSYKYYRLIGSASIADVLNIAELKIYTDGSANTDAGAGPSTGTGTGPSTGMPGYTELTGSLLFGTTSVLSGTTASTLQYRTAVNNHLYVAAVFGTGGWNNGIYAVNNVDYRSAFDSKVGIWLPGPSYFDGAKLGCVGVEFKTPQQVTSIAYIAREGYSTSRLEGAYFQGSNDGVNYTTLFVVDQVRAYGYPYGMSFRTVADGLKADKAYKYFRMVGNANMSDVFNIAELKLYTGSDAGSGNAGYRVTPPQGPSVAGMFNNLKNSAYDPYYSNVLLLNEDRIYQTGAAWANEKLDLTKPFSLESYVYMYHSSTNKAPTMADGITFTLQNDPRGLNAFSQPGGTLGEALGIYGNLWVKNALSIELDTKVNIINPATNDECVTDPAGPHIAVVTPAAKILPANHNNPAKFTHANKWYAFNISWTPSGAGGRLDYSFDGKSYSYTVANTEKQFKG
ncbi:MAG: hypothetical protein FWG42_06650, partial [Clostridiales bacterium]|nr:hypothetical protein [Clostridiales bacterium]